jgi:hypothetical protein
MHLGLIDRPFVHPQSDISSGEPCPFTNVPDGPRFKILKYSGSEKGTQIHYHFLSKSPGRRIPSRFHNKAPMERDTRLQGIFTYFSYLFISMALRK